MNADSHAEYVTRHEVDPIKRARKQKFLADVIRSLDAIEPDEGDNHWLNDPFDHIPERKIEEIEIQQKHKIAELRASVLLEEEDDLGEEVPAGDVDNTLNERGRFGYTPLHSAVVSGDIEEVRNLLTRGANRHIRDNGGNTPYEKAIKFGQDEIASILKE